MASIYAVISDIHGNYQALMAVADDARGVAAAEEADLHFICLGDVVNYGPQPNECVDWVINNATLVVQGNHERLVTAPLHQVPNDLNRNYWAIAIWTRLVLYEDYHERMRQWPRDGLLRDFRLVHSPSPDDQQYVNDAGRAAAIFELDDWPARYILCGHTHWQGSFIDDQWSQRIIQQLTYDERLSRSPPAPGEVHFIPANHPFNPCPRQRALLNPGSVGQPRMSPLLGYHEVQRHSDNRAGYLLLLDHDKIWSLQYRRVVYNVQRTLDLLDAVRWPDAAGSGSPHANYDPAAVERVHRLPEELNLLRYELVANIAGLKRTLAEPADM